jgi:hypothetical protein
VAPDLVTGVRACWFVPLLLELEGPAALDGFAAACAAARAAASASELVGDDPGEADEPVAGAVAVAWPADIYSNASLKFEAGNSPALAIPVDADF